MLSFIKSLAFVCLGLFSIFFVAYAQDDSLEFPYIVGPLDMIIEKDRLKERAHKVIKEFKFNKVSTKTIEDRDTVFNVSLGQYAILSCNDNTKLLYTYGLGPCIGIIISDPEKGVTLLGHKTSLNPSENVVDTLVAEIKKLGAEPKSIKLFWSKRGNLVNLVPLLENFSKLGLYPEYMTNWGSVGVDCRGEVFSKIVDNDPKFEFEKKRRAVINKKNEKVNGVYQRYPIQKAYISNDLKDSNYCGKDIQEIGELEKLEKKLNDVIQEFDL